MFINETYLKPTLAQWRLDFGIKAIASAPHPPDVWLRYVDDTLIVKKTGIYSTHQYARSEHQVLPGKNRRTEHFPS